MGEMLKLTQKRFAGVSGDTKSSAPTAAVWEKERHLMSKIQTSKKLFALVLAVMMMVSVSAMSVSAATGDGGVTTPVNAQLWFVDNAFTTQYSQTLDITVAGVTTPTAYTLGNNTIQKFVKNGVNYEIGLHPQFFAPYTTDPDYDDSANAQYEHNITDVFVLAPNGRYVSCYNNGILTIPDTYALPEPKDDELYFQCKIFSAIDDFSTGESFLPTWYGQIVYLQIDTDN
ncbi:MAG: hypothetical protein LBK73_09745 [Treponema sp.]|jgi:hypothetical protein|nr:hypothetical protein [Treponema sp.]